ncbi:MAG: hypothetical protein KY476_25105 [Planctomycetes bacterium]|nr:hypothetical protein [Planctomycetota bacterium]
MFGQLGPTPYDLRFGLFGIPVRVHPVFWLTAAFIAWIPDRPDLTLVGMAVVFVSVLVHELGHAVTTRAFGWYPEISLEFFGGYATTTRHSTGKDIAVLAAGPGAGFLLYAAVYAFREVAVRQGWVWNEYVGVAVYFALWANLVWNVLNLFPIYPLDGGQIVRLLAIHNSPRNGLRTSQMISIGVAGAVAIYAAVCAARDVPAFNFGDFSLNLEPRMLAIFFALFCFQGIQEYQATRRGYWR